MEKKSEKGSVVLIVIFVIAAVAGIAFFGYHFLDEKTQLKKESLKEEILELENEKKELEESIEKVKEEISKEETDENN